MPQTQLESAAKSGGGNAHPYRGRFAPTPSGPLHRGSLLAALASWLHARAAAGGWLLRIDDLDIARCSAAHADTIQHQLEAHGLTWDGSPRHQSRHRAEYADALERLRAAGRLFACTCTRTRLAAESRAGPDGPVYDGRCRDGNPAEVNDGVAAALRFRVSDATVVLDAAPMPVTRDARTGIGDFVVRRSDGVIGYHVACAVDEAAQGITEVVRGGDLIGAAFCQRLLQDALGLPCPTYRHLPLLVDDVDRKLSKQNHAAPIGCATASAQLHDALAQLGQAPPITLRGEKPSVLLAWALDHWRPRRVPEATVRERPPAP